MPSQSRVVVDELVNDEQLILIEKFLRASNRVQGLMESEIIEKLDLPLMWFNALVHLGRCDEGEMSSSDLADMCGLSLAGVSRLIDRLTEVGYVKRFKTKQDRRVSKIQLTDSGRRVLNKALKIQVELAGEHLSAVLSRTEQWLLRRTVDKLGFPPDDSLFSSGQSVPFSEAAKSAPSREFALASQSATAGQTGPAVDPGPTGQAAFSSQTGPTVETSPSGEPGSSGRSGPAVEPSPMGRPAWTNEYLVSASTTPSVGVPSAQMPFIQRTQELANAAAEQLRRVREATAPQNSPTVKRDAGVDAAHQSHDATSQRPDAKSQRHDATSQRHDELSQRYDATIVDVRQDLDAPNPLSVDPGLLRIDPSPLHTHRELVHRDSDSSGASSVLSEGQSGVDEMNREDTGAIDCSPGPDRRSQAVDRVEAKAAQRVAGHDLRPVVAAIRARKAMVAAGKAMLSLPVALIEIAGEEMRSDRMS